MSRQLRKKSESKIYHVMLRGINKQDIFHDEDDMYKMFSVLGICTGISKARLHAYCLMKNHIHLLVETTSEPDSETLSQMMKRVGVRYVSYYNSKYKRIGSLFQDRFRSEPVDTDAYFLTALRYIHRNPVKAGFVETPDMYRWSSYNAYLSGCIDFVDTYRGKKMLGRRFAEYMNVRDNAEFIDIDKPVTGLSVSEYSQDK